MKSKDADLLAEAYGRINSSAKYKQHINEESYDAMQNLGPKAVKIRELLKTIGDDEMTEEHSYKAAEIIAGGPSEWAREEYQELIESLAHVIRAFGLQSMN